MNNKKAKKLIASILISIFILSNYTFANTKTEIIPKNVVSIDENLELYVSGASTLIEGELLNPLTVGCANEELKDIPVESILKAIVYKNPDNNEIEIINNVNSLEEINRLFKYPDEMSIRILVQNKGYFKEINTNILTLRSQEWIMNVEAGGTMTFVTEDKKYFGILAHDYFEHIKFKSVKVYTTKDVYINKSGNTLSGFTKDKYIGDLTHSSEEGSFGIVKDFDSIPVQGKYKIVYLEDVKKGPAYIISQNPKTQESEKIKIDIKSKKGLPTISKIYSIVYKLNKESMGTVRNGIGPGYSGSPIIQNGKLIGGTSVKYDFSSYNKFISHSLKFIEKYIGGVDIYKYLYRMNNLNEDYCIIDR